MTDNRINENTLIPSDVNVSSADVATEAAAAYEDDFDNDFEEAEDKSCEKPAEPEESRHSRKHAAALDSLYDDDDEEYDVGNDDSTFDDGVAQDDKAPEKERGWSVFTYIVVILTILVIIFTFVSLRLDGNERASLFGYKPYVVLSNSMEGVFSAGDIVVTRIAEDGEQFAEGDIITFCSIDTANYGEIVTHKIREVLTSEGGVSYITYGVSTGSSDAYPALRDNVIGKYAFRIPKLGRFFMFLKTPAGYIILILVPFLIIIGLQLIKLLRLWAQYKNEQQQEIDNEKQKIAQELEELKSLRAELQQMQSELKQKKTSDDAQDDLE